MPEEPDMWSLAGRVRASTYREAVLRGLEDSPSTPSNLTDVHDGDIAHTSRSLTELSEMGLVECKNPDAKKGRIYAITELGEQTLEKMEVLDS